jgi:hypothetical protein
LNLRQWEPLGGGRKNKDCCVFWLCVVRPCCGSALAHALPHCAFVPLGLAALA